MLGDLFPRTIVASPHLAWFWLYCCVPHKIFSISSNSLRPVCFDRRNAARPPGSRLNILSDTNSGFYSIRNPADTHCCPSRTNPAFLLVGWCHTGLAKTPICQQEARRRSTATHRAERRQEQRQQEDYCSAQKRPAGSQKCFTPSGGHP